MSSPNTTRRVLHCWADGPRVLGDYSDEDCGTTCMLEAGHAGPHEWTRDDGINVEFSSDPDLLTGCADDALPGTSEDYRAALEAFNGGR